MKKYTALMFFGIWTAMPLSGLASPAHDNASDSAYSDFNWIGRNGGQGWQPWYNTADPAYWPNAGTFMWSSTAANPARTPGVDSPWTQYWDPAWGSHPDGISFGLWSAHDQFVGIGRQLNNSVQVGETIIADLGFGPVDVGGNVYGPWDEGFGFDRADGSGSVSVIAYGDSNYQLYTPDGQIDTGIAPAYGGFRLSLTSQDGGLGRFTMMSLSGGPSFSTDLNLYGAQIGAINAWNAGAGPGSEHDMFLNNVGVVPEPASLAALAIGGAALLRRPRKKK